MPLRLELGPKDMVSETVLLVRRDVEGDGKKTTAAWNNIVADTQALLARIQVCFGLRIIRSRLVFQALRVFLLGFTESFWKLCSIQANFFVCC